MMAGEFSLFIGTLPATLPHTFKPPLTPSLSLGMPFTPSQST